MSIRYEVRNVYGLEKLYVIDAAAKSALETLTGKITIDERDIDALRVLGITFVRVLR